MSLSPKFLSAVISKHIKSYARRSSIYVDCRNFSYLHHRMANAAVLDDDNNGNNGEVPFRSQNAYKPHRSIIPPQKFQTKERFLSHFDRLISSGDVIDPKDAFMMIKACGRHMISESTSTKNELLQHVWAEFEKKGVHFKTQLWNTLLSVYIENNHDFDPVAFLKEMWQKSSADPNHSTFTLLVKAYAVRGDPIGAMKIVEFMLKNDEKITEVVYGFLVRAFAKNGDMEGVNEIFVSMRKNNISPRHAVYEQLINVHAENGDIGSIGEVIEKMVEKGIYPCSSTYLDMMEHLVSAGHSKLIEDIWNKIDDNQSLIKDIFPLILQCITSHDYESAVFLVKKTYPRKTGDLNSYESFITKKVYSLLKYSNKDIKEYVKASISMNQCFDRSSAIFNLVLFSASNFELDKSLELIQCLSSEGQSLDKGIFYQLLKTYVGKNDIDGIVKICEFMIENDVPIDKYCTDVIRPVLLDESGNDSAGQLLSALLGLNSYFNGSKVADMVILLHNRGISVSSIVQNIMRQLQNSEGHAEEALVFLKTLVEHGVPTVSHSYTYLLKLLAMKGMSEELYSFVYFMKENDVEPDVHQYYQMLHMASLNGDSIAAQHCFDKLSNSLFDAAKLYELLIYAYKNEMRKKNGPLNLDKTETASAHKLIHLFNEMVEAGIEPKDVLVAIVIQHYLLLLDIEGAAKVAKKFGLKNEKYIQPFKMRAHNVRGEYDEAIEYFKKSKIISPKSTFLFNEMLHVYESMGDSEKVEELYQEMIGSVINTNSFTQRCRIKAFLRAGEPEHCLDIIENGLKSGRYDVGAPVSIRVLKYFAVTGDINNVKKMSELLSKHNKLVTSSQLLTSLVLVHVKLGDLEEASIILSRTEDSDEMDSVLDLKLYQDTIRLASNKGDVSYIENLIRFLKMNSIECPGADEYYLKALDKNDDVAGIQHFYSDRVDSGMNFDASFMDSLRGIIKQRGLTQFEM